MSATSARQRQVTPNYSVSLEGSASVCPLCKDQERVQTVRSRSGIQEDKLDCKGDYPRIYIHFWRYYLVSYLGAYLVSSNDKC